MALYRRVWRVQRRLPLDMQALANTFIRHEFREHYDRAEDGHLTKFMHEWRDYVNMMEGMENVQTMYSQFSEDQRKRMELLERTIKT